MFLDFFFFNDTATTEIYTLSLHDALPILTRLEGRFDLAGARDLPERQRTLRRTLEWDYELLDDRSEEHTSELQSQSNLVCRLLLEKKKKRQFVYAGAPLRLPILLHTAAPH